MINDTIGHTNVLRPQFFNNRIHLNELLTGVGFQLMFFVFALRVPPSNKSERYQSKIDL